MYIIQVCRLHQLLYFFSTKFIYLLLEQWRYIVVAMLLFLFGGLAAFLSVIDDPLHFYSIMPEGMAGGVNPEQLGEGHDAIDSSLMSAEIMTNRSEEHTSELQSRFD